MRSRLDQEVAAAGLGAGPSDGEPVTEDELHGLPEPAQRYLRYMGVPGRRRERSFRVRFDGRFRMAPGRRWMRCEAWQYNTVSPISRTFHMRLWMGGAVPMIGRDTYVGGRGRMRGSILGKLDVVDGSGPELDLGELVTWVDDALMMAPSMLLPPVGLWSSVDRHSFDISVADGPNAVIGRVFVDGLGRMTDFRTTDRWYAGGAPLRRVEWHSPIAGWVEEDGRPLPASGAAVWELPEGPFRYAEGYWARETLEYDVWPETEAPAGRRIASEDVLEGAKGAAQIAAALIGAPLFRSSYDAWGATPEERCATMPGDELVPLPKLVSTRAITIEAPPRRSGPGWRRSARAGAASTATTRSRTSSAATSTAPKRCGPSSRPSGSGMWSA